jgi:hypothetical protein
MQSSAAIAFDANDRPNKAATMIDFEFMKLPFFLPLQKGRGCRICLPTNPRELFRN